MRYVITKIALILIAHLGIAQQSYAQDLPEIEWEATPSATGNEFQWRIWIKPESGFVDDVGCFVAVSQPSLDGGQNFHTSCDRGDKRLFEINALSTGPTLVRTGFLVQGFWFVRGTSEIVSADRKSLDSWKQMIQGKRINVVRRLDQKDLATTLIAALEALDARVSTSPRSIDTKGDPREGTILFPLYQTGSPSGTADAISGFLTAVLGIAYETEPTKYESEFLIWPE